MGTLATVYSPAVLVMSSRVKPFSGFETVTLAPGITPPEESITVPTIVAVSCAEAEKEKRSANATSKHGVFTAAPPISKMDLARRVAQSFAFQKLCGSYGVEK